MRRLSAREKYTCEEELCEHLCMVARRHGYVAYVETAGFDVLLVAGDNANGFRPGDQIGVQAKLRDSVEVLAQALPHSGKIGPHYYAVLVPSCTYEFEKVASRLEIGVIRGLDLDGARGARFFGRSRWKFQDHGQRCWVPEVEVEGMRGGRKGPEQLTPWKMKAVKLCMLAEERGYLTSRDFREVEVSLERWIQKRWLVPYDKMTINGRAVKRYVLNNAANPPHLRYGAVTDALGKAGIVG